MKRCQVERGSAAPRLVGRRRLHHGRTTSPPPSAALPRGRPVKDHLLFIAKVAVGVIVAGFLSTLIAKFTAPKAA